MTAVELLDVGKRYGAASVLTRVSMRVSHGEIVGLIGPNGAGKTTLLRIVAGFIRATSGAMTRAFEPGAGEVRYFGGEHTLPPTVPVRTWQALWQAHEPGQRKRMSLGMLSRGTRQRVGLAATLATGDTEQLLLLDEPWEGLDPDASRWLSDALARKRQAGVAILVSSHRIHDLASIADRCDFLICGHVATSVQVDAGQSPGDRTNQLLATFARVRT